jgi:hypothetical protein
MSNSESWTDKTENIIHLLHLFSFQTPILCTIGFDNKSNSSKNYVTDNV